MSISLRRFVVLVASVVMYSAGGSAIGCGDSTTTSDGGETGDGIGGNHADGGTEVDTEVDAGGGGPQEMVDASVEPAPNTTITSKPKGALRGDQSASFEFACDADDCTFECAWDSAKFAKCVSPAKKAGGSDGPHLFVVRATRAGQVDASPAKASFQVDAVAPRVTLASKPSAQRNSRASAFSFACSEDGCTFECSLDDATFAACDSDVAFDGLAPGSHTLKVRATDAVGNPSSKAVSHTWMLTFGWLSLAVADRTACAVSGERKLYCWGSDNEGLLGDGGPFVSEVAARASPSQVGTSADWTSVSAGANTICATTVENDHLCWGDNSYGEFGDPAVPDNESYAAPTAVDTSYPTLSLGDGYACAIDAAETLLCWGDGSDGQIGDGDSSSHSVLTPTAVGSAKWKAVSAGSGHTCAIRTNGKLFCFGNNEDGECGQPGTPDQTIATPIQVGTDSDWTHVATGYAFTCARKANGTLYCWGQNYSGVLGNGTHTPTHVPTQVGSATDWRAISAHGNGACGIKDDGRAFCWGANDAAQIGSAFAGIDSPDPVQVDVSSAIAGVHGSDDLRCALTDDAEILCWGDNANSGGGLGRGVPGSESTPIALDSSYIAISLTGAAYGMHAGGGCGIKDDGKLYCWGLGRHLGISGTQLALAPTAVSSDTGWTVIDLLASSSPVVSPPAEPYGHACGIRNGDLYCWGPNEFGQLGLGDTTDRDVPTQVTAVADTWVRVTVGTYSTCGVTSGKRVYCWGRNSQGELGQGDTTQRSTPIQVGAEVDWDTLTMNGASVTGRRENGTIWRWGAAATSAPVQADSGNGLTPTSDWYDVKALSNYWCGYRTDGTLQCRILDGALQQVMGVSNVIALLDLDGQTCGKTITGSLFCIHYNGTDWVTNAAPYVVPPTDTDWLIWEQAAGGLACGVKEADGKRYCMGPRNLGSLGDGFDERVPAPILEP